MQTCRSLLVFPPPLVRQKWKQGHASAVHVMSFQRASSGDVLTAFAVSALARSQLTFAADTTGGFSRLLGLDLAKASDSGPRSQRYGPTPHRCASPPSPWGTVQTLAVCVCVCVCVWAGGGLRRRVYGRRGN